jgi:transketolase
MGDKKATREAYGQTLLEIGREHPEVVVLDADLSKSTMTAMFAKEFPERFFNMGIAEQNMMGTAAGLAASGKIPFVSTFAMFATGRAFEQVRNTIANPKLPVKIAASHAGITVGPDGASHQSIEDIALMRVIPNMTVFNPADAIETRAAIKAALTIDGPVYIRLGRHKVPVIFKEDGFVFEMGKAQTVRDGSDVTVIATGIMVSAALEAAKALEDVGISVRVVNMSTLKPLDEDAIVRCAKETGFIVTAEEHSIIGGLGSAVSAVLAERLPTPMRMIGIRDSFGQSGKPDELLKEYGLTFESIVKAVKKLVKK